MFKVYVELKYKIERSPFKTVEWESPKNPLLQNSNKETEKKCKKNTFWGFPGGAVVETLPANAGNMG